MKDRIQTLLLKKHLSPNEFANRLNMNRSNVSHLLSGRSKLSVDNLAILMKEFPDISIEWLLLGEGNMFKINPEEVIMEVKKVSEQTELIPINKPDIIMKENERPPSENKSINPKESEESEVEKIIIFYKDKTCSVYICNT